MCEFGETVMWFVPKKLRSKLDQRWRYGVFLGRALGSDQNFIGVNSGEVVCARAMIRVVPNIRWSSDRISKIHVSPMEFKIGTLDHIEEASEPHAHPQPSGDTPDEPVQMRRVRLFDADVKKYGYTSSCPRCDALRNNRLVQARGLRHNEECRERIYNALRADGVQKVTQADSSDSYRTKTKHRKPQDAKIDQKPQDDQPVVSDAPEVPLVDMDDAVDNSGDVQIKDWVEHSIEQGGEDFYKEVDADAELGVD